jgi:hypothetical protein
MFLAPLTTDLEQLALIQVNFPEPVDFTLTLQLPFEKTKVVFNETILEYSKGGCFFHDLDNHYESPHHATPMMGPVEGPFSAETKNGQIKVSSRGNSSMAFAFITERSLYNMMFAPVISGATRQVFFVAESKRSTMPVQTRWLKTHHSALAKYDVRCHHIAKIVSELPSGSPFLFDTS